MRTLYYAEDVVSIFAIMLNCDKEGKLLNADVNGSFNILRLGKNEDVIIKNAFNPVKLRKMNELCDVAYFKWQPTDRGLVFLPDSSIISTVKDVNGNYKFSHKS